MVTQVLCLLSAFTTITNLTKLVHLITNVISYEFHLHDPVAINSDYAISNNSINLLITIVIAVAVVIVYCFTIKVKTVIGIISSANPIKIPIFISRYAVYWYLTNLTITNFITMSTFTITVAFIIIKSLTFITFRDFISYQVGHINIKYFPQI